MQQSLFADLNGAIFSDCMKFRYRLWRVWDETIPRLTFCCCNPSTADASKDDPTIRRCIGWAKRLGYGSFEMINIFAFRSTQPKLLFTEPDPVGSQNDFYIRESRQKSHMVIAAWGEPGKLKDRGRHVYNILREFGPVHCLKINESGAPCHPLYLPGALNPIPYTMEVA